MINVLLIDDEYHCLESLEIQLKNLNQQLDVVAKFTNSLKALHYLKNNAFDILFLDIEMLGLNGFELLKEITNQQFDVVFTTA